MKATIVRCVSGVVAAVLAHTTFAQAVTSLGDSGPGSLREILASATNGSTISFATSGTITLTTGELSISNSVTLTGPGATNLAISGNFSNRVFNIGRASGGVTSMIGRHDRHTATLLASGYVLVVGGPSYLYPVSSAEQCDSGGENWNPIPNYSNLIIPRFGHAANLLNSGLVLFTGGTDATTAAYNPAAVFVFDANAGDFAARSSMNSGRYDHTATRLNNGRVLVAGGVGTGGWLASTESYDSTNDVWTAGNSLNTARSLHTATLLTNGSVLVTGGYGNSGILAGVEICNATNGTWLATNALTTARYSHTATRLTNGQVLVVGGVGAAGPLASVEIFNPATGGWTNAAPLFAARFHHTATLLADGKVLVLGGIGSGGPLASAEIFDPGTLTWLPAGSLTTPRESHTATLLTNGKVLVAGGSDATTVLGTSELFESSAAITVNISGLTLRDGTVPDGVTRDGGAIHISAATVTLTACALTNNFAGRGSDGTTSFASSAGGGGGAIHNAGKLQLAGCTLSGNFAGRGGNGSSFVFGSTSISLADAGRGGHGGAINNVGTLSLSNCTFHANRAGTGGANAVEGNGSDGPPGGHGGAVFNAGRLSVVSCTFSGNAAGTGGNGGNGGTGGTGGSGGAIHNTLGEGQVTLRNSLLAANSGGAAGADGGGGPGAVGAGPDLLGAFVSAGYNLVGKTDGSSGLVNGLNGDLLGSQAGPLNALLGPLRANGGTTLTLALLPGSPALDAGDDTVSGADQRGQPRLAGAHVDIGAFELSGITGVAPVITNLIVGPLSQNGTTRLWSAPVSASVNPGGLPTTVSLAFGATTSYGAATASVSAGSATTNTPVSQTLSSLMPGTLYHFRLVAANAAGTAYSTDQTVSTGLLGDFNGDGVVSQPEYDAVYTNYLPTSPWVYITNTAGLGGTNVTFSLLPSPGAAYRVQFTTNLSTWLDLGPATPRYEFTDTNAPAAPVRSYRLIWP